MSPSTLTTLNLVTKTNETQIKFFFLDNLDKLLVGLQPDCSCFLTRQTSPCSQISDINLVNYNVKVIEMDKTMRIRPKNHPSNTTLLLKLHLHISPTVPAHLDVCQDLKMSFFRLKFGENIFAAVPAHFTSFILNSVPFQFNTLQSAVF